MLPPFEIENEIWFWYEDLNARKRDYSRKERALRERGTMPSPCRKRPLTLRIEEAEAPQANSFDAEIIKYCIAQKVIDVDQTGLLTNFS